MSPTLLTLFGLSIPSYQALIVVAVLTGWVVGPAFAERLGGAQRHIVRRAMLWITLAAFAGARAHYVLNHLDAFASSPLRALAFWEGGLHAGGGILGTIIAVPLICARAGLSALRLADLATPTIALSLGITRIGCFLKGCCAGIPCDGPVCVAFPRTSMLFLLHADAGLARPGDLHTATVHPLQLYFSATAFGIAVLTLYLYRRHRYDGEVAFVGLVAFALSSAALEWLRADYPGRVYWAGTPQLLWTAIVISAAGAIALAWCEQRHRRRTRAKAPLLASSSIGVAS